MSDTIVRTSLQVVGGDQMLTVLRAVRQEIVGVAQQRARVTVDADTVQARQQIALFREETARLRAEKYGLTITADTAQANRSLQQITLETQRINALVARARVEVDTSQANRSLDETDRKLSGITDKIGRFALYGAGYALYGGISQAVGAAGDAIVGYSGRLEQARIAYANLLGSAQAADRFLAQEQQFAKSTPFDFAQVQKYAQLLLATGTAAKEIIPDLTTLGNAVSAVGGDSQTLDRVVLALSQMRNSVHLNAQDMNQLIQAGINGWKLLADQMGITEAQARKMGESGEISGTAAAAAILEQLSTRNVGLMEATSRTFLGRLENFKDTFTQELAQAGKPLFDELSTGLEKAGDAIASPKFQQFAHDLIADLATVVHAGEQAAEAIGKIPVPVLEAGVRIAELALAVKTAEIAIAAARTVLSPLIGLIGTETAAHVRNTAAIEAETVATTELATAKGRMGAAGIAGTAESAVAGGAGGNVAGKAAGVGIAGAGLVGSAAIGIAVGEGMELLGRVVPDLIHKQFADAAKELLAHEPGTPWGLAALIQDGLSFLGIDLKKSLTAAPGINQLVQQPQGATQPPPTGNPLAGPLQGMADQGGATIVAQLLAQVAAGTLTANQAREAYVRLAATFGPLLHNAGELTGTFLKGLNPAINAYKDALGDAAAAQHTFADQAGQVAKAMGAGASSEDISRAMFGVTGTGAAATPEQIKAATQYIGELEAAQTSAQQRSIAAATQFTQDLKTATQQAAQAIGSVDLSKGFASVAAAAPALDKARESLMALGQSSSSLNALASMADEWKSITDATDKASASFRGYLLLTSETDGRIQQLQSLKKSYDDLADAADAARKKGQTLTPDQRTLLRDRPAVDANIDAQVNQLRTGQATNYTAAVKVAPDFVAADQQVRQWVQNHGGAGNLDVTVKALTDQANVDLKAFLDTPRQLTIKAIVDTSNLPAWLRNVAGMAGGTNGTNAAYTDANGRDLSRFNAGAGGDTGTARFYSPPPGGAAASTPRGAPSNLLSYADLIKQAAAAYNVPEWLLGAIILHESGGNPGAVQPGGLGRGLTQVDIGQNPSYDEKRLTGTGRSDIAYQIDSGAEILAQFLKVYGGDVRGAVQNYAGPAYRSQAGNGVEGGLDFYTELNRYYRPAVEQTLGGTAGTSQNDLTGTANTLRTQIVQKALQSVDQDKLVNECERFVEETVQAITGRRGATGVREPDATTAFANAQKQGLETHTPQPGDLVYYPSPNGGPGHVAIYMGNGQQVSTYDGRGTGDQNAIHVESVAAGARYVRVPGLSDVAAPSAPPSSGNRAPDSRFDAGQPGTVNLADPNTDAAQQAAARYRKEQGDLKDSVLASKAAQDEFNHSLQGLSTANLKDAVAQYGQMSAYFTKIENAKLPDNADAAQKQTALNLALADSLNFAAAYDNLLKDIQNHTGDVAADTQRLASIVGGPLAQAYAQMATASAAIANADAQIKNLQAQQKTADAAHQVALDVIKGGQDAINAAHQTATNRIQDAQTGENDRYTPVQRGQQDRARQLQFSQQLQATDLQNSLVDLQQRQTNQTYNRTAQEQVVAGDAKIAGTREQAAAFAASLAAMHERDLRQKDADTKAVDDLQTRIRLESRQAAVDSYNLETETIKESRKHEDILAGIARESTAEDRRYQRAQADIQAATDAENSKYQDEKTANQAAIDAQNTIKESAQASLDAAQTALAVWQQTGQVIATAGQSVASSFSSLLNAQSLAQFPNTGAIRRLDGHWAGGDGPIGSEFNVGDAAGGAVTPYTERVRVTERGVTVTPLANRPASDMGGVTIGNLIGSLTVGADDTEEAFVARVVQAMGPQLRQVYRAIKGGTKAHLGAIGRN